MSKEEIVEQFNTSSHFFDTSNTTYPVMGHIASGLKIWDSTPGGEKRVEKPWAGPCHGGVGHGAPDYIYTTTNPAIGEQPGVIMFFDWLVNKSCFRELFITKDPVVCAKQGTIMTTECDPKLFLNASQLCRLPTSEFIAEFAMLTSILEDFGDIHPLLLLLVIRNLAGVITNEGVYWLNSPGNQFLNTSHHLPVLGITTEENLKVYCDNTPTKVPYTKTFKEQGSFGVYCSQLMLRGITPKTSTPLDLTVLKGKVKYSKGGLIKGTAEFDFPWKASIKALTKKTNNTLGGKDNYLDIEELKNICNKLKLGEAYNV